jgi:subtilisin-like proprotein convertase family protein
VPPFGAGVLVSVDITHKLSAGLVIQVVAPDGQTATLSSRQGVAAADFVATRVDSTRAFAPGSAASGTWQLVVRDLARLGATTLNAFSLTITSTT